MSLVAGGVGTLLTLFRLRRSWRHAGGPLRERLARAGVTLYVRGRWLGRVRLTPDPGLLFRLTLPRT